MRVVLDECLPKRLTRELPGHEARTVQQMGWSGISNGKLLSLIRGQFDAFLTVDIAPLRQSNPQFAMNDNRKERKDGNSSLQCVRIVRFREDFSRGTN